eukprot:2760883-Alexandrium_andersonii.AAC.1
MRRPGAAVVVSPSRRGSPCAVQESAPRGKWRAQHGVLLAPRRGGRSLGAGQPSLRESPWPAGCRLQLA